MACKCLIFDWDGTLIDSAARIVACLQSAADEMNVPVQKEDKLREVIGLSLPIAIEALYPDLDSRLQKEYAQIYRDYYLYKNTDPSPLFDKVEVMLADWQRQGYYLAIATGKSRVGLKRDLGEFNLQPYFHVTKTADETATKPDPLMLQEILVELDIKANEAIMIGDTSFDINMARNINMYSVGLAQGAHTKTALEESRPGILLDSIQELPAWLAKSDIVGR